MAQTPFAKLYITDDNQTVFSEWRKLLNGTASDSNMSKIDTSLSAINVKANNAVPFNAAKTLTDAQKQIARDNIGAASEADISKALVFASNAQIDSLFD